MKTLFGLKTLATSLLVQSLLVPVQAAQVDQDLMGYKCVLKPNTLVFEGGQNSEAKRVFAQFSSLNIYMQARLLYAGDRLKPIAEGSLEFHRLPTLTSIASNVEKRNMISDRLYPTEQVTEAFDKKGNQLKTLDDAENLPEGEPMILKYTHVYVEKGENSAETNLSVVVTESIITDHTKTVGAKLKFSHKTSTLLPPPVQDSMNGSVSADLICSDQIGGK